MGFDLIAYGLLMAGLGMATARFAPSLETLAYITGLSACGTGLLWGVIALRGQGFRNGAIMTLAVVSGLALWLNVSAWLQLEGESGRNKLTVAITGLMLFLSIG
ncbi:MAG: hypothetical protein ACO1QS_09555, partial [Verrucomicrobiota bacterium]